MTTPMALLPAMLRVQSVSGQMTGRFGATSQTRLRNPLPGKLRSHVCVPKKASPLAGPIIALLPEVAGLGSLKAACEIESASSLQVLT
jgi:hypothetical protein